MINLIPSSVIEQRRRRCVLRRWIKRLPGLAGICFLIYLATSQVAGDQIEQFERANQEYNALLDEISGSSSLIKTRDQLWSQWETVASIHNPRTTAWYLEVLGESLPQGCHLNRLNLSIPDAHKLLSSSEEIKNSTVKMGMNGSAGGHSQIRRLYRALKESGAFTDVQLITASDQGGAAGNNTVIFEMKCERADIN